MARVTFGIEPGHYRPGTSRPRRGPALRQKQNVSFRKLEMLPCFEEVRKRLLAGVPAVAVAKFVKGEGFWTERRIESVVILLGNYKRVILVPSAALEEARNERERKKRAHMALDEVEELEKLYGIQAKRIGKFHTMEEKLPIPLKHIDDTMRVALSLLQASANLKMELGLNHRAPMEANLNVDSRIIADVEARYGKESLARVMASPKKRSRVLSVIEMVLEKPSLMAAMTKRAGMSQEVEPEVVIAEGVAVSGDPDGSSKGEKD